MLLCYTQTQKINIDSDEDSGDSAKTEVKRLLSFKNIAYYY